MRVLFINHPESDYGGAFLYNGLCSVCGDENVFDVPLKLSYHGKAHLYSTPAIQNGMTCPLAWMVEHPRKSGWAAYAVDSDLTEESILELTETLLDAGKFDLVVVESCRTIALATLQKLLPKIRANNVPIVIHDGEDGPQLNGAVIEQAAPVLYLKRETLHPTPCVKRLNSSTLQLAFPFSFPQNVPVPAAPYSERTLDVALLFGDTHKLRRELVNRFSTEFEGNCYAAISGTAPGTHTLQSWYEYMQTMTSAHLGISARGFGWDTCRFWEVPMCTAMLCDVLDLVIPFPFTHGINCLTYSSVDEALENARKAQSRTKRVEGIYLAGREHLLKHHTNEARAQYMIDILQNERKNNA